MPGYIWLIVFLPVILLSACRDGEEAKGYDFPGDRARKRACIEEGGHWERAGMIGHACLFRTKDAGKSCTRATDCEGTCLADTRSCSAIRPMFGCYSMLDENGEKLEICVD